MLLFPALWSRSRLNGLNNLNFMADRHELSGIEYHCYRTEVLDLLLSWQDEDAGTDKHLVIKDRDLESLVSDLTDSIVYRVVEDRKSEAVERWAAARNITLPYKAHIALRRLRHLFDLRKIFFGVFARVVFYEILYVCVK